MAAWHEPPVQHRTPLYWVALYVYLLALAGVFVLIGVWLWTEVLAAWPK